MKHDYFTKWNTKKEGKKKESKANQHWSCCRDVYYYILQGVAVLGIKIGIRLFIYFFPVRGPLIV